MLAATLILLSLRTAPIDVGAFLSAEAKGSGLFLCHISTPYGMESTFADTRSLMHDLGLLDRFSGRSSGFRWDSSAALPFTMPMDADLQLQKAVGGLSRLVGLVGDRASELIAPSGGGALSMYKGLDAKSLHPSEATAAQSAFGSYTPLFGENDAKLQLQVTVYVAFSSPDGGYKSFVLRPSRDGGKIAGLGNLIRPAGKDRMPKELRERLSRATMGEIPAGQLVTVGDLVTRIGHAAGIQLYLDRRFASDRMYVRAPATVGAADLADGLAKALDLYWRKVGSLYFLAVSPSDGHFIARQKFYEKTLRLAEPLLRFVEAAKLLPDGLGAANLLAGPQSLADFPQGILSGMAGQIVESQGADKGTFMQTIADGSFLKGTVEFFLGGYASIASESSHASIGGVSFRLDANQ